MYQLLGELEEVPQWQKDSTFARSLSNSLLILLASLWNGGHLCAVLVKFAIP